MATAEITYLRFLVWTPEEPKEGFVISLYRNLPKLIPFPLSGGNALTYMLSRSETFGWKKGKACSGTGGTRHRLEDLAGDIK